MALLDYISCAKDLLGDSTYNLLYNYIFRGAQIAVPILIIMLVIKDLVSATVASDEKEMKKAQTNAIKRIVVGVIFVLLPTFINVILNIVGLLGNRC